MYRVSTFVSGRVPSDYASAERTLRRAAAPYADGAQRLVVARTHGTLLVFMVHMWFSPELYIEFCVGQFGTHEPP